MEEQRHNDNAILVEIKGLKEIFILELKHLNDELAEAKREAKEQNEKFNSRINIIELWQSNSVGKIAIISIAVGLFITIAVGWVTSHLK